MLSEVRGQILYELSCMWNLKMKQTPQAHRSENRWVFARGREWGAGEIHKGRQKGTNLLSPGDIMYNISTTVNNTVLHMWKLVRH